jgi:hypothetical protein
MNTEFFAGVNTENGFKGYLEEYFRDADRLYIIKGTPGSGKSTLMKRLASDCEKKGFLVWRILCSSDPASLDGIYLPEKRTGIADGTSPHVLEPKYPLAKEILFDTGRFIDAKKLDKEGIISLSCHKAECYKKGYGYIKSAVCAERACKKTQKREAEGFFKARLLSSLKGGADYRVSAAFTKKGIVLCNPFPQAEERVAVDEDVLNEIILLSRRFEERVTLSPHPTHSDRFNGVYFHGKNIYITAEKEEGEPQGIETAARAYALARKAFGEGAVCHGKLEEIYSSAMNFSALEEEYPVLLQGLTE